MPSSSTVLYPSMDRKVKKPLMEKRRRARINQCLSELKNLVLQAYSSAPPNQQRASKLEKADILEMTVQYVRSQASVGTASPSMDQQLASSRRAYIDGYSHCAQTALQLVPPQDRPALMSQLSSGLSERLKSIASPPSSALTLSIPPAYPPGYNQASQPTPPFTFSNNFAVSQPETASSIASAHSLISPASNSGCDSPCESTYSSASSGFGSTSSASYTVAVTTESSGLLTPVTPSSKNVKVNTGPIWRPW